MRRRAGGDAGPGLASRTFAWLVVSLSYLVVPAWIVAAVLATLLLPAPRIGVSGELGTLVPEDVPALRTELRSLELFRFPLLARTAVVQRDPDGLSPEAQARIYLRAFEVTRRASERGDSELRAAIPVTNTLGVFPGSREDSTTGVTFLFFGPSTSLASQSRLAHLFARGIDDPDDGLVGVTGPAPARLKQGVLIADALPRVEVATVLLIAVILGLSFRALGAPLATLAAAGLAYMISVRVVTAVGERIGVSVPKDLEPVMVVLVLGIVTDYSVFFLFGMRDRLRAGSRRLPAARATTAQFAPIIITAGLTVAAGTAALAVASLDFLRAFGPALALTVLTALVAAVTFVPACLAVFGRWLYWPHWPPRARRAGDAADDLDPRTAEAAVRGTGPRERTARLATAKPVALVIAVLVVAALTLAAWHMREARLGFSLIRGLPPWTEEHRAERAAADGFAPGIVSPTEILLEAPGIAGRREALVRLQELVERQPGVAGVLGPRDQPVEPRLAIVLSADGRAARLVVILAHDPLGGAGIEALNGLRASMPELLERAGLGGVRHGFAGNTALAAETVDRTLRDLGRIALATLVIDLVLLVVFLRALVAPLYLLAASVLGLLATLGLTTLVVQRWMGLDHLTYYVPFAAAVLLVSLGSDYNIFIAGRMWEEARRRPLREAISVGARRATHPITIAGITLALSFALLALVPVRPFREFALTMAVGVILDSFVVRSFLVPGLVALFGRTSFWPGRRGRSEPAPEGAPAAVTAARAPG